MLQRYDIDCKRSSAQESLFTIKLWNRRQNGFPIPTKKIYLQECVVLGRACTALPKALSLRSAELGARRSPQLTGPMSERDSHSLAAHARQGLRGAQLRQPPFISF